MSRRSPVTDFLRQLAYWTAVLSSGCLGGQSGGETGEDPHADAPAPCACMADGTRPVRARVTALAGGCAELQVIEVLVAPAADEHLPLRVGDVFGGVLEALCQGSAAVQAGDEVLALFDRGSQTTNACPEYRACSADNCGSPDAAYTTAIDPECAAEQQNNADLDCPPVEHVDEALVIAYDRCDAQCLEENREVCASHAADEQLSGRVKVARWVNDKVQFYWAGKHHEEPFSQLLAPACSERHRTLWGERPRSTLPSNNDTAQQAPNDGAQTPTLTCP